MKLLDVPLGLLINFNVTKLSDGVSRLILPGADSWRFSLLPLRPPVNPVRGLLRRFAMRVPPSLRIMGIAMIYSERELGEWNFAKDAKSARAFPSSPLRLSREPMPWIAGLSAVEIISSRAS
jgi:hypothetical protein